MMNISRCYVVKQNKKLYVIGSIMAVAIVGIVATFHFQSPRATVAYVLSSSPIRSTVVVRQSYCHIALFPIPATVKDISGHHSIEYGYRIFTLFDYLKAQREYPALTHSALNNCIEFNVKKPRIVAYDVNYVIGRKPGKIRIGYKPDETIPLNEKGQLILKSYSQQ